MVTVNTLAKTGRRPRKPQHAFRINMRPYLLTPFMLAPVLPGETMKNLLLQARAVSGPIKSAVQGWWFETYFFYVKLRDLTDRDKLTQMLIDPTFDKTTLADYSNTDKIDHYFAAGGVNYVNACLERVYDEFFINQDTDAPFASATKIDNLPVVAINNQDFTDSLILDADYYRPDVDVDIDADGTVTASEVDQALRNWQWLRSSGLTEVSYEDYLRTFGIRAPSDDPHIPELVRYIREWTYPTNTVEPTTGVPTSAVSWSIQERADKDRFFREPGFLFGVMTSRPKVYFKKQRGLAASFLDDALSWLPAVMREDPLTSMKKFAGASGPMDQVTSDYWIDMRDLFLYGEQYTNVDPALTLKWMNWVDLPDASGLRRYPSSTDLDSFFVTPASDNKVRVDGVVSLNILGAEQDYTATTQGQLRAASAA